ncbi:unnamed protein product, partial [Cyprideis torosa]
MYSDHNMILLHCIFWICLCVCYYSGKCTAVFYCAEVPPGDTFMGSQEDFELMEAANQLSMPYCSEYPFRQREVTCRTVRCPKVGSPEKAIPTPEPTVPPATPNWTQYPFPYYPYTDDKQKEASAFRNPYVSEATAAPETSAVIDEGSAVFRKDPNASTYKKDGNASTYRRDGEASTYRRDGNASTYRRDGKASRYKRDDRASNYRRAGNVSVFKRELKTSTNKQKGNETSAATTR